MRAIHRYASLGSTMQEAAVLASSACAHGTVVLAEEQTAGQGRYGRHWHSPKGAGLYFSQVLRLKICPDSLPLVTLALGLAVADAVTRITSVACDLRWPNDVLVNGKKCAGILAVLDGGALIAGIGVNVNHLSFPPELESTATSLRIESGREQQLEPLLNALLESIETFLDMLTAGGKDPILRMFAQASSYVSGRRVSVDQGPGTLHGTTAGLDPQGFLILKEDSGKRTLIVAGGVRPYAAGA